MYECTEDVLAPLIKQEVCGQLCKEPEHGDGFSGHTVSVIPTQHRLLPGRSSYRYYVKGISSSASIKSYSQKQDQGGCVLQPCDCSVLGNKVWRVYS